jgi:hypothetical protein
VWLQSAIDPVPARLQLPARVLFPKGTRGGCRFGNAGWPGGCFVQAETLIDGQPLCSAFNHSAMKVSRKKS